MADRANASLPEKAEPFTPAKAPPDLLLAVSRMGDHNIVQNVVDLVEFDYEITPFTRQDARDLVSFVRRQTELDEMVLAPTDSDFLDAKINRALEQELNRILEENEIYQQIAKKKDGKVFVLEASGEKLTPAEARKRLDQNTKNILEIKRNLTEQKKANVAIEGPGAGINLTFDLGTVVSDGVRRIKEAEAEVIDVQ